MVGPLPLQSGAENESEPRMTVGKLSPNLDGFALFHHKTLNEALKWRWILCLAPTLTLSGPSRAGKHFHTPALGRVEIPSTKTERLRGALGMSWALPRLSSCPALPACAKPGRGLLPREVWDSGSSRGVLQPLGAAPSAPRSRRAVAGWLLGDHPCRAVSQGL